jgi:hypothetical protein
MVSTARIKARLKVLLEVFGKNYVKAYKSALILSIRDSKNPKADAQPDWQLLMDADLVAKNPRIEGDVYIGEGFKTKKRWTMAKNYIVRETPVEEKKGEEGKDGAVAPDVTSDGEEPASPRGDGSSSSGEAQNKEVDQRIWLDDACSDVCMNPACGEKFGLLKRRTHCRHCGEIFCSKCTSFKIEKNKFCEDCYKVRTEKTDPTAELPVLERPTVKTRMLNFNRYKAVLPDHELFANAGAKDAAAKAGVPAGSEGKWLIVLSHRRSTRPQFTVAFDSKEQRDQWMGLIHTAARNSPMPITTDPMLQKAFLAAYRRTRWYAYWWHSWWIDGTESELIADLLYDVMEYEIFGAELSKLGPMPRKIMRKVIIKMIEAAVSAAWSSLQGSLAGIRGPLESTAEKILGPLFEKEAEVKDKVKAPIEEAASKAMEKNEAKLQEMFGSALPVIAAAGEAEVNLIHNSLCEVIASEGHKKGRYFRWGFEQKRWSNYWCYWGKNLPISQMIDVKLNDEDASYVQRDLAYHLRHDLTTLNQSAFKRIELSWGNNDEQDLVQSVRDQHADIMRRAAHDAALILEVRLFQALDESVRGGVIELLHTVVKTITEPLDALIPDLLKDILDPERTCMEIINDILVNCEKGLIKTCVEPLKKQIEEQGEKLATHGPTKLEE